MAEDSLCALREEILKGGLTSQYSPMAPQGSRCGLQGHISRDFFRTSTVRGQFTLIPGRDGVISPMKSVCCVYLPDSRQHHLYVLWMKKRRFKEHFSSLAR